MEAFLKRVWLGMAATLIVCLAVWLLPDQFQIDDDGRLHIGAPATPRPEPTPEPTPEDTSPPLTREAVDEAIQTAVRAAGLDPEGGKVTAAAGSEAKRTGWMAVRDKAAAQSEMKAICADLERQGWTLNPNPEGKGANAAASRSYKRGGWFLLVSTREKTQAPSTTLSDSQTSLTLTGIQVNLSDIPLPDIQLPDITIRMG